ncbi:hypothetical protein HWV62_42289 [Athelia sp. TMB]|nr:hypothetical protein HWV62_42289 [Athelia sp. TMB]
MASRTIKLADLLSRNSVYQETYTPPRLLPTVKPASLPTPAGITIISCCDQRVIPEQFLQLARGECPVIRNAGGRAADALSTLLVLDSVIPIGTLVIIHHTDCGLTHITDDAVRARLAAHAPGHEAEIAAMQFGAFREVDVSASVLEDIQFVRSSPYLRKDMEVRGFVLDIRTGAMSEVEVDAAASA